MALPERQQDLKRAMPDLCDQLRGDKHSGTQAEDQLVDDVIQG